MRTLILIMFCLLHIGYNPGLSNSGGVPEQLKAVERSTTLYVGTEQGHVATLDWRPPESESGKLGGKQERTTRGESLAIEEGSKVNRKPQVMCLKFYISVTCRSASCWCHHERPWRCRGCTRGEQLIG